MIHRLLLTLVPVLAWMTAPAAGAAAQPFATVAPATPVTPPAVEPGQAAPARAELTVMSFNIRYGTANDGENRWANRRPLVREVFADHRPDIAGLQEALRFQLDEIRADLPEYQEIGVGRSDGLQQGEYAAILYRGERLSVDDSGAFWFSDTPEVPGSKHWGNNITRICTWARFTDAGSPGTPGFYVFNVHLDHESEASRRRSGQLLAQRILARAHPHEPVIVLGDFNTGEASVAIRLLTTPAEADAPIRAPEGWIPLIDTFRVRHPDVPEPATFTGFKLDTPRDGSKIDYILVSPAGLEVLDASIDRELRQNRPPSDHYPVVARLRLVSP